MSGGQEDRIELLGQTSIETYLIRQHCWAWATYPRFLAKRSVRVKAARI